MKKEEEESEAKAPRGKKRGKSESKSESRGEPKPEPAAGATAAADGADGASPAPAFDPAGGVLAAARKLPAEEGRALGDLLYVSDFLASFAKPLKIKGGLPGGAPGLRAALDAAAGGGGSEAAAAAQQWLEGAYRALLGVRGAGRPGGRADDWRAGTGQPFRPPAWTPARWLGPAVDSTPIHPNQTLFTHTCVSHPALTHPALTQAVLQDHEANAWLEPRHAARWSGALAAGGTWPEVARRYVFWRREEFVTDYVDGDGAQF